MLRVDAVAVNKTDALLSLKGAVVENLHIKLQKGHGSDKKRRQHQGNAP
jgi:hypothetical protein